MRDVRPRFTLTKWYLDAVDDAGRSAIAYWTRLAWGRLAFAWQGLSLHGLTGGAVHRSGLAVGDPPAQSGGRIIWDSAGLGCRMACEPWCGAFEPRLLDGPAGFVDWSCLAPGSAVTVDAGSGWAVTGTGYVERLVLTLPPWRLPISELRWGRWISPGTRRSVVWIDWRGPHRLTLVLDRGQARPGSSVGDDTIAVGEQGQAGAAVLRLDAGETLYTRTLSERLEGAGRIAARLPRAWRALEDRKTRGRGTLDEEQAQPDAGWAIHERVRFPTSEGRR